MASALAELLAALALALVAVVEVVDEAAVVELAA